MIKDYQHSRIEDPRRGRVWRREMGELETDPTSPFLVSVVVPAFNEEKNIPNCVQELSDVMRRAGYKSEIIVVNDGSTDNTLSVARSLQSRCSILRVLD